LIGYIPQLLSKIVVPNKMTNWGGSGLIASIDGTRIWLSEPVDFDSEAEGVMYICHTDGSARGPYTVTPTEFSHCVEGTITGLRTMEEDDLRATRYLFGLSDVEPMMVRVGSIKPQGRDEIKISGSIIDDAVYTLPGTCPEIGEIYGVQAALDNFNINYVGENSDGDNEFYLTWAGTAEKVLIAMDTGGGYVTLVDDYVDYEYTFVSSANTISVKVTPYVDDVLETALAKTIANYKVLVAPAGLTVTTLDETGIELSWTAYSSADKYYIVMKVDGVEVAQKATTETSASITMHQLQLLDGPWPEFDLYLTALVGERESKEAHLAVSVDALDESAQVDFQARMANGISLSWEPVDGALSYLVCHSASGDSDGEFTPALNNVVYEGTQASAQVGNLTMSGSYEHCFKVAAQQYNHAIADLNFTAALLVTPATADVSVHSVSLNSGANQNYTGPSGGSSYTYQLAGTASGNDETVTATLTGSGTGQAYCVGDGSNDTTASLSAISSGSSNVCNVAISGGGSFAGSLIITKIS
jgi:hypothetical protein